MFRLWSLVLKASRSLIATHAHANISQPSLVRNSASSRRHVMCHVMYSYKFAYHPSISSSILYIQCSTTYLVSVAFHNYGAILCSFMHINKLFMLYITNLQTRAFILVYLVDGLIIIICIFISWPSSSASKTLVWRQYYHNNRMCSLWSRPLTYLYRIRSQFICVPCCRITSTALIICIGSRYDSLARVIIKMFCICNVHSYFIYKVWNKIVKPSKCVYFQYMGERDGMTACVSLSLSTNWSRFRQAIHEGNPRGGGGTRNIYWWGCALSHQKGGS